MTRRQAMPKALKPTGPVQYQESTDQTGPKYVYKASYCDVLCGWPERPSFKGLAAFVKDLNSLVLTRVRTRGSKLVHFEGPLQEVERIKAWAHEWPTGRRTVTCKERPGRPVCQGVPLYKQEYSPCRGCPDTGACHWRSLKNPVCMRYMKTVRKEAEVD